MGDVSKPKKQERYTVRCVEVPDNDGQLTDQGGKQ